MKGARLYCDRFAYMQLDQWQIDQQKAPDGKQQEIIGWVMTTEDPSKWSDKLKELDRLECYEENAPETGIEVRYMV